MSELPKKQLGRTGLQVTTLGYGAMELRGAPRGRDISEEDAGRILNAVLDAGINYIDTSIDYGLAEERIGRHLAARRSEYYLASKCGCAIDPRDSEERSAPHVFTADQITAGVEGSLRRLKTDYLDVVQFHHSPTPSELEADGGLEALQKLQREGKVRFIGISGTIPNLKDQIAMGVFDVFQIPYSVVQREHEALIDEAAAAGGGIVIRGGAARGGPDRARGDYWERWQEARLDEVLDGMSPMEFVLRYTYSLPSLSTTIVGTLSSAHLQDNVDALLKGPLPPDLLASANARLQPATA